MRRMRDRMPRKRVHGSKRGSPVVMVGAGKVAL